MGGDTTVEVELTRDRDGQDGLRYNGTTISRIVKGTPAESDGRLRVGDTIVAVNGAPCATREEIIAAQNSKSKAPGETVTWTVTRRVPADPAARRPYVPLSALQGLWLGEIAPRTLPEEASPASILSDALALLANQGELFISGGLVFLDPAFATELLKPLVDHRLKRDERASDSIEEYVRATVGATQGKAGGRNAVTQLLRAVDTLCSKGMLSEELLPFLWRGCALRVEDYPHATHMLCGGGAGQGVDGTEAFLFKLA